MRKLELLPEVLPAPTDAPAGAVRARTLAHMHRLLATAAAGGSLLGCTRDAVGPSDAVRDAGGPAIPSGAKGARLDLPESGTPTTVPTPPTTGYAVVDPVPMPAACPSLASEILATAMWKAAAGDAGALAIEVTLPASSGVDSVAYSAVVSAYGGTVLSTAGAPAALRILVQPTAGVTSLSLTTPAHCNGRPVTISVSLDASGAARAGAAVRVYVSAY